MKKLLNAQQVADILGVSKTTVCTYCKRGILPAFQLERLWRIDEDDVIQFIMERKSAFLKKDPLYGVPLTEEEEMEYNKKLDAAKDFTEQVLIHASYAHRKIQKTVVAADIVSDIYVPTSRELEELLAIEDDAERAKRYEEISKQKKG